MSKYGCTFNASFVANGVNNWDMGVHFTDSNGVDFEDNYSGSFFTILDHMADAVQSCTEKAENAQQKIEEEKAAAENARIARIEEIQSQIDTLQEELDGLYTPSDNYAESPLGKEAEEEVDDFLDYINNLLSKNNFNARY